MEINHPNRVICPRCGRPGTKQVKMIKCKNPNCTKCPHGPYYYVFHRIGKKVKSCYIGKKWGTPVDNGMLNAEDLELTRKKKLK